MLKAVNILGQSKSETSAILFLTGETLEAA